MSDLSAQQVREIATAQYQGSTSRLAARAALHMRFSTATRDWWPWVYDHIAPRPNDTVVEIGAGPGALWHENHDRVPAGLRVLLTDASPAMCQALTSLRAHGHWIVQCDAQQLPVAGAIADIVVAAHMLYHVPDIDRALEEIARVLAPGGRLIVTTNGERHMWQLEDLATGLGIPYAGERLHHPFGLEEARRRINARFTEVKVERYDDSLLVTDPDAVLAYVESVVDLDAGQRTRLRAATQERIQAEGALRIDKVVGLVTARR